MAETGMEKKIENKKHNCSTKGRTSLEDEKIAANNDGKGVKVVRNLTMTFHS